MKKIKLILAALLVLCFAACSSTPKATTQSETQVVTTTEAEKTKDEQVKETITLNIKVLDQEENVLFDDEVTVPSECETLEDVLNNAPQLQVVSESGSYGMTILGLMGVEGDWDNGPWWLYESENNEACAAAGFCDGASVLKVQDGDIFIFKLTSEF